MDASTDRSALASRVLISAFAVLYAAALAACATSKDSVIPKDGPTMAEIYKKHMAGIEGASPRLARERLPLREPEELAPTEYTRSALNEINNRFGRLPNPDLVGYVFPHLAGNGRYPVPGYVTVFPMYESVEYALPGEVSPRRASIPAPEPARTERRASVRPPAAAAASGIPVRVKAPQSSQEER